MAKFSFRKDESTFEALKSVAGPVMQIGGSYIFDGIEFEYVGPLRSGLHQFIDPKTGEPLSQDSNIHAVTNEWLTDMIAAQRFSYAFRPLRSSLPVPDWTLEEIQAKDPVALMRQKILLALDEAVDNGGRCTRAVRQMVTVRVCHDHPNLMQTYNGIPSDRQVLVWYKTYGEPGRRPLRACVSLRGRVFRTSKLQQSQIAAIRKAALWYCDSKEPNFESAWEEFKRIVTSINEKIRPDQDGERVHYCARATFFVHFHKEMESPWLKKKLGERAYRARYKGLGKGNEIFLPGEAYEVDHTVGDIFLKDLERDIVIGRPYITSIIDVGSRAIISLYVTFVPPSMSSLFEALKIAFCPRQNVFLADRHPALKGIYGIPKKIITDRGAEFTSSSFCFAIIDLGIGLFFARVREPEDKPEVEKGFRTINDKLIHRLKGVAFYNVDKKLGDYDPGKHAVLDLHAFSDVLNKFVSLYNLRGHDGLEGASPASVWHEHARFHNPRTFLDLSQIARIAGVSRKRSLSRKGVRVEHLQYGTSHQITELLEVYRRARGGKSVHPVRVVSNSMDMGEVDVYCEPTKTFVTLRARDYDYACGLSLYLHKKIRKARRQKAEDIASQDSIDIEFANLRAEAAEGNRKKSTQAKKKDAARLIADIDAKASSDGRDFTAVKSFAEEREDGSTPLPAAGHKKRKPPKPAAIQTLVADAPPAIGPEHGPLASSTQAATNLPAFSEFF